MLSAAEAVTGCRGPRSPSVPCRSRGRGMSWLRLLQLPPRSLRCAHLLTWHWRSDGRAPGLRRGKPRRGRAILRGAARSAVSASAERRPQDEADRHGAVIYTGDAEVIRPARSGPRRQVPISAGATRSWTASSTPPNPRCATRCFSGRPDPEQDCRPRLTAGGSIAPRGGPAGLPPPGQRARWNTAAATMVPRIVPAITWLRVWSRSSMRDQPTRMTSRKPRAIHGP